MVLPAAVTAVDLLYATIHSYHTDGVATLVELVNAMLSASQLFLVKDLPVSSRDIQSVFAFKCSMSHCDRVSMAASSLTSTSFVKGIM